MKMIKENAKGMAIAFIGAMIANLLHLPLPWLIGPILMVMLFGTLRIPVQADTRWRKCGQVIIGVTLGLYFSPELVSAISSYWFYILVGIVWAVVLNLVLALLQYKINHVDWATAWFSSSIGSASEMVNVAERYQARTDQVAAAHSLRIVILVVLIPIIMGWVFKFDLSQVPKLHQATFSIFQVLMIILGATIIAKLFDIFNVLNAWLLGPLILTGILSYTGFLAEQLPVWLIYFGQLCIGWSLGAKFPFDFLSNNKTFIFNSILFNVGVVIFSLLFSFLLFKFTNTDLQILMLGLAPGGIAEMSLTAKALGVAVPIVVAFQVSRLIFVIVTTGFLYKKTKQFFKP